ncbi:M48 family metallopeptidase [Acidobacteriia bacterium AH_259_A11_L15]|nr:M48 family metallopeptidase [Acidobacteriia bacterium AH_259_A11_L15]
MRSRNLLLAGLAGALALLPVLGEEPRASRAIYNIFSDPEEVAIGRNAAVEIEQHLPMLEDRLLEMYLERVGQQVAAASQRPELAYHFRIVNTPEINAFAVPGGYIYVYRGLLDFVETESQLVAVLGHEVGHIAGFHGSDYLSRQVILERIIQEGQQFEVLSDEEVQGMLAELGGPVVLFVERKFGRDEELEADLLGLYSMVRAGWHPQGMVEVLEKLQAFDGDPGLLEQLMSTHPLAAERVEMVAEELAEFPDTSELAGDSLTFQAAKARLSMLPPPPGAKTRD